MPKILNWFFMALSKDWTNHTFMCFCVYVCVIKDLLLHLQLKVIDFEMVNDKYKFVLSSKLWVSAHPSLNTDSSVSWVLSVNTLTHQQEGFGSP